MAYTPKDDAQLTTDLALYHLYNAAKAINDVHDEEDKKHLLSLFKAEDSIELRMSLSKLITDHGYEEEDLQPDGKIAKYIESNK